MQIMVDGNLSKFWRMGTHYFKDIWDFIFLMMHAWAHPSNLLVLILQFYDAIFIFNQLFILANIY